MERGVLGWGWGDEMDIPTDKIGEPFEAGWDIPYGDQEAGEEAEELVTKVREKV